MSDAFDRFLDSHEALLASLGAPAGAWLPDGDAEPPFLDLRDQYWSLGHPDRCVGYDVVAWAPEEAILLDPAGEWSGEGSWCVDSDEAWYWGDGRVVLTRTRDEHGRGFRQRIFSEDRRVPFDLIRSHVELGYL